MTEGPPAILKLSVPDVGEDKREGQAHKASFW